jgi:hypothetical protein
MFTDERTVRLTQVCEFVVTGSIEW